MTEPEGTTEREERGCELIPMCPACGHNKICPMCGTDSKIITFWCGECMDENTEKAKSDLKAKMMAMLGNNELLEILSELEHEQWIKWSQSVSEQVLKHSVEETGQQMFMKHQKWLPNWIPYEELDEPIKEFDRIWARKVIEKLKKRIEELK